MRITETARLLISKHGTIANAMEIVEWCLSNARTTVARNRLIDLTVDLDNAREWCEDCGRQVAEVTGSCPNRKCPGRC